MITIKNTWKQKPEEPWQVRVDRNTPLGNPYYMENESKRDYVCDMYEEYFKTALRDNPAFTAELDRLAGIYGKYGKLDLFCWCAPKRCHAETIKAYLEQKVTPIIKHNIIARCGRYALISRENPITPYIVACGYDDKTGEWNQGYYFTLLSNAANEYAELSGFCCAHCPNANAGCVICKK